MTYGDSTGRGKGLRESAGGLSGSDRLLLGLWDSKVQAGSVEAKMSNPDPCHLKEGAVVRAKPSRGSEGPVSSHPEGSQDSGNVME